MFAAPVTAALMLATLNGVRMPKYRMFFKSTKAEQNLGCRARPSIEAIDDAVRWFRGAGYLRR